MTGQGARRWAEINSAASWRDTSVRLLIAGSGVTPGRVETTPAKIVLVQLPVEPRLAELVIVTNPVTADTHVITAGAIYVAARTGLTSISLSLGTLYLRDSHVRVAGADSVDRAISAFTAQFTSEQLGVASERYGVVRLAEMAPLDFFVRGSQPVNASLESSDMQNGFLRLRLRSHDGTIGEFSVDLGKRMVVKAEFSRPPTVQGAQVQ